MRMTRLTKWGIRAALIALAGVVLARPAHAQTVLVQVVGADNAQPLVGALAHLVDASGEVVASRLADRSGRALFAGVAPGRYRVRAEMLGHSTGESDVFGVADGGSVPLVLRLETHAITLAGVEVTAEAGPCEVRPEEGRLLADVWDEARKALSATAAADREGAYRYSLVLYEQDLDVDGVIEDEEQTRQRGYMRTPFASRAVEELTDRGFVHRTTSEWDYYAPDAEVLLSDPFLDTHCLRLVIGDAEQEGLVGLQFEPTGENEDVPDISGTLWLDRDSVALRWLEYTYENLEPDVRPGDATGRVEFQRMPEGTWIVPEWWIRMPYVEVDVARSDRRRRITGFHKTGGRVMEIVAAGGRDLGRGVTTGAIEGIVVDSLGVPIKGVRVGTVGSSQTLFTNAEGRFNLVNLMEGTYRVRFIDPDLEALGLQPPEITREVLGGVSANIEFLMPKPGDLLREACGDEAEPGTAVLGGVVRDATTGQPIPNGTVRVTWSKFEIVGAGSFRNTQSGFETTTDGFGVYRFCSVPRREELTLVSSVDDMVSTASALAISSDEDAHLAVLSYAPARGQREADPEPVPEAPAVDPPAPGPPFTKRGQIVDAKTRDPLSDALVELRGQGSRAVSDADGHVTLSELAPGSYTLVVERLGYEPLESAVEVADARDFMVLLEPMGADAGDDVGTIVGRVTGEGGEAISNVDVHVIGQEDARTVSNQQGRFRIDDLEPGILEVQFDRIGYRSRSTQFVVQRSRTAELAVVMATEAVELEPIEVTVRAQALVRNGFYERLDRGFGTQIDRKELERINPEIMYDVVRRAPGVNVTDPRRQDPFGRGSTVGNSSYATSRQPASSILNAPEPPNPRLPTGPCYLSVYVDGAKMSDPDLSTIQPSAIEALEVYTGSDVPDQYTIGNPCGVILVWTRR